MSAIIGWFLVLRSTKESRAEELATCDSICKSGRTKKNTYCQGNLELVSPAITVLLLLLRRYSRTRIIGHCPNFSFPTYNKSVKFPVKAIFPSINRDSTSRARLYMLLPDQYWRLRHKKC